MMMLMPRDDMRIITLPETNSSHLWKKEIPNLETHHFQVLLLLVQKRVTVVTPLCFFKIPTSPSAMGFMMPSIPSIPVPEVITLQFVPWLHGLMVFSTTKTVGFWLDPAVFL